MRPTTDASLDRNLALRLEYASLDVQVTDNMAVMFGLHEMPWLTFEETLNRYRVLGPFFSERAWTDDSLGLLPGPTDLGASIKYSAERSDFHVGVYNGEGGGRAEIDKYKSIDGRATFRPFAEDSELGKVSVSGFYQYGWYARRPPAQRGHRDGRLRERRASPPPRSICRRRTTRSSPLDVQRRGLSFFGEVRQGVTGWAGIFGLDLFDPNAENDGDNGAARCSAARTGASSDAEGWAW